MKREYRSYYLASIGLISVLLCCSLFHISVESSLAVRTETSPSLPGSIQNETIPGSGEPGVSANPGLDFFALPPPQSGSSKIAFASNRDGNAEIYSMNADGCSLSRLTTNDFNDEHPRWSPDGTRILFHSDRDNPETGNADVYVMNTDGSDQTRLTIDVADDSAAVWSPDGTKIVFQSLRNGQYYQVCVMNADGRNQINLSNGSASGSSQQL